MDPFEYETERFLSRTIQLWVSKLEAELWKFAEALDAWFYGPYRSDPSKWREQLAQVLDEQASLGRELIPKSRGELFAFLENRERTQRAETSTSAVPTQLTSAITSVSEKPQPRVVAGKKPPPRRSGHRPGPRHYNDDEGLYLRKLAEANRHIDEIEPLLAALAGRIEGAKPEEELDVTPQLEAIDALIWRHNDALESARDTWLRGNISSDLYAKLDQTRLPTSLGLPLFTDRDQAARAKAQAIAMGQKFKAQIAWLDNVIFAMEVMEKAGDVASFLLVAGPLITVLKSGTKVILKTAAKAAGGYVLSAGIAEGANHALRAAGVSEETIQHIGTAVEIVSRLLLVLRISGGSRVAKPSIPKPKLTASKARPYAAAESATLASKSDNVRISSNVIAGPPDAIRIGAQRVPKGGPYREVRAGNVGGEVHHTPANSVSPFSRGEGPSVWMEKVDHVQTASWGSSRAARAFRQRQQELIGQGRLREAMQMDIDDLRSKFGSKYDEHIRQMLDRAGFSE